MSNENPDLLKVVTTENPLKQMLVNYVGEKVEPENDEVNIEMIIQVMAEEFPDMIEEWIKPEAGLIKGIVSF